MERIFRYLCRTPGELGADRSTFAFPDKLSIMFPELLSNVEDPSTLPEHYVSNLDGADVLGGVLLQPVRSGTTNGGNAMVHGWMEEILAANHPKLHDSYSVDDHSLFSELHDPKAGYAYARCPFSPGVTITNATGYFSGFPLLNWVNSDAPLQPTYVQNSDGQFDIIASQVLGSENVLWGDGTNFSPLAIPPNMPNTLTQNVQFSSPDCPKARDEDTLKSVGNAYASSPFAYTLLKCNPKRYNYENLATPKIFDHPIPQHVRPYGDPVQPGSSNMLEAIFQYNDLHTLRFFAKIARDMEDLGDGFHYYQDEALTLFNQHTACRLYTDTVNPPIYKFLSNGDGWAGASLTEYIPLQAPLSSKALPPKAVDCHRAPPVIQTIARGPGFDMRYATNELVQCDCNTELICDDAADDGKPSRVRRSFRYEPYVYHQTVPTFHPRVFDGYMRAMLGDARVATPSSLIDGGPWTEMPVAANKMMVVSNNAEHMSYLYGRPPVVPFGQSSSAGAAGWDVEYAATSIEPKGNYVPSFPLDIGH